MKDCDANGYRVRVDAEGIETYYLRDASGLVLSEFRKLSSEFTAPPTWDKDGRAELEEGIESWILLRLSRRMALPTLGGARITISQRETVRSNDGCAYVLTWGAVPGEERKS